MSQESETPTPSNDETAHERVFLVVVDDTEEMQVALRFACRRASHTGGRVALLEVIEPVEFQHWLGVGRVMQEEARADAEMHIQSLAAEVFAQTGRMPSMHIREGKRAEELSSLIEEDPSISLLVLATAIESNDPGPLVSYLIANMARQHLRVPITLVPGHMTTEEIDAVT